MDNRVALSAVPALGAANHAWLGVPFLPRCPLSSASLRGKTPGSNISDTSPSAGSTKVVTFASDVTLRSWRDPRAPLFLL